MSSFLKKISGYFPLLFGILLVVVTLWLLFSGHKNWETSDSSVLQSDLLFRATTAIAALWGIWLLTRRTNELERANNWDEKKNSRDIFHHGITLLTSENNLSRVAGIKLIESSSIQNLKEIAPIALTVLQKFIAVLDVHQPADDVLIHPAANNQTDEFSSHAPLDNKYTEELNKRSFARTEALISYGRIIFAFNKQHRGKTPNLAAPFFQAFCVNFTDRTITDADFSHIDFEGSIFSTVYFENCVFDDCEGNIQISSTAQFNRCSGNNCKIKVELLPDTEVETTQCTGTLFAEDGTNFFESES